jgi:hypothetical protein
MNFRWSSLILGLIYKNLYNNYNSEGDMIMNDLHSALKTTIVKGLSEGEINSFFRIKPIKTSTWVLFIHLDI